ncbi:MAG: ATP-dependent RNA helicase RhlB [Cellvibrionaceae bacterium]
MANLEQSANVDQNMVDQSMNVDQSSTSNQSSNDPASEDNVAKRNQARGGDGNNRKRGSRGSQKQGIKSQSQVDDAGEERSKAQERSKAEVQQDRAKQSRKVSRSDRQAWDLSEFPVVPVEGKTRFHDFDLPLDLMHAIADLRFEYCSPIQAQSLPFALNGQDLVGKAQTGTGKTAAFLVAIIDDLLKHPLEEERFAGEARALIIAPTRELVLQIAEDAKLLSRYTDLEVHTLVGGMDYGKQQSELRERLVDILVATPGRLLDFCSNGDVHLDQIEVLVIDEADRMLDMGFIPQIRRVIRQTPPKTHRQTLLFSATFSPDVMSLVEQWTVDRVTVEIEPESVATDTVTQYVYLAATDEKYKLLYNILKQEDVDSLLVFSNRRDECRDLYDKLRTHGFAVGLLSGEINQKQRVRTLDAFKSGETKVLVATDVAGRGIHIDGISHVVNLNLPEEPEDYVHRIGRTGRAGKRGTSISFACEDDAFRLMPIQELLGAELKCTQPPESLLEEPPEVKFPPRTRQRRSSSGGGGRSGGGRSSGGGGRSGGRRRS